MASSKAMQARDQMSAGGPYPDPEYANMKSIWHFLVEDNISIITQSWKFQRRTRLCPVYDTFTCFMTVFFPVFE